MNLETPIRDLRFSAIDFESAGVARGQTDIPIQIGMASWTTGGEVSDSFVSYLKANRPVAWSAQKVHGITDDELTDAPRLQELWPEIRSRLGNSIVVAHGKGTEKRFLRGFPGHGFGPWVDTLLLARAAWPQLESHSLSALCEARKIDQKVKAVVDNKRWHDALFDAVASLILLREVIECLKLEDYPLACLLQPDLSEWHRLRSQ